MFENAHWQQSGKYIALLFLPVIWAVHPRAFAPLIGITPALLLNIFSTVPEQRLLQYQYSLPMLPFLMVMVVETLHKKLTWLSKPASLIGWSALIFCLIVVRGFVKHGGTYPHVWSPNVATWEAEREAITLVPKSGKVLATFNAVAQLSHREVIRMFTKGNTVLNAREFDSILINTDDPGWVVAKEYTLEFAAKLLHENAFSCVYQQDGVYLFLRS